jgi:molecular chaperone HscC
MSEIVVGIDLGTTNSLCSVFLDGKPQLIPNAYGGFLTPSVVGLLNDGQVVVGSAARELQVTRPLQAAATFKRWMGTDRKVKLGDRDFSPIELSSLILRSLKDDAGKFLKQDVTSAVITVPAYFNENQRKATKQAGEMAGLKVRRIINEPTAAALTYGFHDPNAEKHIIVIDLGGGTFDVTVMEIFEGSLEIISTAGESMLGGEDFTDRILSVILQRDGKQLETAEIKEPLRTARLRQECEIAKRALLDQEKVRIRQPDDNGMFNEDGSQKTLTITRETFSKVSKPLLDRIRTPIDKAIRDGDLTPDAIDEVIMVGGATRMPLMQKFISEYLDCQPQSKFNPDEVVALGAAVQAALIDDDAAVDDMVMTDVCPFTLGVEISKEFGGRVLDGYYYPVIHRNTTIPVSKEESFNTISPNQRQVNVKVYQGEARKVENNLLLGELEINDLPPGPAGQEIFVRFTFDMNGLLEIEVLVPQSGKKYSTVLKNNSSTMSDSDMAAAVAQMQQLKFYPRDDLKNQRLLLFGERMVGEVSTFDRDNLESIVDVYEHALNANEPDTFEQAKKLLLVTLSSMGVPYEDESGGDDEP